MEKFKQKLAVFFDSAAVVVPALGVAFAVVGMILVISTITAGS